MEPLMLHEVLNTFNIAIRGLNTAQSRRMPVFSYFYGATLWRPIQYTESHQITTASKLILNRNFQST
jgi:hypothetical protein